MLNSKTTGKKKHEQMQLDLSVGKRIELAFDGGQVCSDGGILLLRKADTALELLEVNAKTKRPKELYENRYCQRAQCENWIKDLKTYLKCDRTSCQEWRANQFRLLEHVFAYILLWQIKNAVKQPFTTMESVKLKFIKIGVLVRETANKVILSMASHHPWIDDFHLAWRQVG